ncbi:hypothetical protein Hgul01_03444 [Herpetosiphon gulosus]|uniref:Uncharacterized protein n=1 Tax=Herpetosiphon gulosus TaxID=1973496 RepID=A0ABP9X2I7_9CHLR
MELIIFFGFVMFAIVMVVSTIINRGKSQCRSNGQHRRHYNQHNPAFHQHNHNHSDDLTTGIGIATGIHVSQSWDSNNDSSWSNDSSSSFDSGSWSNNDSGSSWSSGDSGGSWSSDSSSSSSSDSFSGDSSGSW